MDELDHLNIDLLEPEIKYQKSSNNIRNRGDKGNNYTFITWLGKIKLMNHYLYRTLIVITLIILVSCKKEAVEVNSEYLGHWRTDYLDIHDNYIEITFTDDGKAHYKESGPTMTEDVNEKAKIKNSELCIGSSLKLEITQAPFLEYDSLYTFSSSGGIGIVYSATMNLNNIKYYRVEKIFY